MKKLRKVIFWIHLTVGVLAGAVILLMSVTGVLLMYERQMISWADRIAFPVQSSPAAKRLSISEILAAARHVEPVQPSTVTVRSNVAAPIEVSFGRQKTLFIDPVSGQVLGAGSTATRAAFRELRAWHRWIGAKETYKPVGKAISGAGNLIFLFLVLSGLVLWFPRTWKWNSLRGILLFRRGIAGRSRDFNWHNVIGFWCAIPLFFIVISGVVISYSWAGNLVYNLAGEPPPVRAGREIAETEDKPLNASFETSVDHIFASVAEQRLNWNTISISLPASDALVATVTVDEGTGGQPQKRIKQIYSVESGELVRVEPFSSNTLGSRLKSYLRFLHTGEVGGLPGQTLAGIASLGAIFLVWTGLALAWRRWRS